MNNPFEILDNTTAVIAEMTDYNDYEVTPLTNSEASAAIYNRMRLE